MARGFVVGALALALAAGAFYQLNIVLAKEMGFEVDANNPNLPPCKSPKPWYTALILQGETWERFLCLVVPFVQNGTALPLAKFNFAQLLLVLLPVFLRLQEAALSAPALSKWFGLWVLVLAGLLGNLVGISVTLPGLALPLYCLAGGLHRRPDAAVPVVSSLAIAATNLAAVLVSASLFVFTPHTGTPDDPWTVACVLFQGLPLLFLVLYPVHFLLATTPTDNKSQARAIVFGLYTASAGVCASVHVLSLLSLLGRVGVTQAALTAAGKVAWASLETRFLIIDHAVVVATALLFVLHDSGFTGALVVVFLAPFLSVGGAVSAVYAWWALAARPAKSSHKHADKRKKNN